MIFGTRAFFGYITDAAGGTVWFANVPRAPVTRAERDATTGEQWKRWLLDLFADDRGPAAELIASGELELGADNTHDLPSVPTWHKGRSSSLVTPLTPRRPRPDREPQWPSKMPWCSPVPARRARYGQAFVTFERLRRRRVERIVAQGARSSSSKAAGPIGRVLRDRALPFVFRYLVTERSMSWLYEHHVEWDRPVTANQRVA